MQNPSPRGAIWHPELDSTRSDPGFPLGSRAATHYITSASLAWVLHRGCIITGGWARKRGLMISLTLTVGVALCAATALAASDPAETWTFDRIDRLGGHVTTVLGHPRVIDSPLGKAVEFNGVDD